MWWNSQRLLSYNKTLNACVSNRGGGKTIESMRLVTSSYLKTGHTAVWLRRWDTELDATFMDKFFTDFAFTQQFNEYEFKTKKSKNGGVGYIKLKTSETWEPYIQFMCLNTALKHKSVPFPSVRYIIFDEFIIDKKSNMRYLKNEVFVFLELLQSIMRLRSDVRVLFLGNSLSVVNPYFIYFNIRRLTQEFTIRGEFAVQLFKDSDYTQSMKDSRFGKLVSGSQYETYAIENEFIRDKETFIEKKSPSATYWFALKYDDDYISIWQDGKKGLYYVDDSFDSNRVCFATTTDAHDLNTIMLDSLKTYFPIKSLIWAYDMGKIRFKNIKVQSIFYDIMYLFGR